MKKINYTRFIVITLLLVLTTQTYQVRVVNANSDELNAQIASSSPFETNCFYVADEKMSVENIEKADDEVSDINLVELIDETIETVPVVEKAADTDFITSNPDITFTYKYVIPDDVMPYALVTPSTVATNEKTPLIISLHGMGDRGTNAESFKNKFVAKMMREWKLDGFNAYVLIPHLTGDYYSDSWNDEIAAKNLFELIDRVIMEYDIDTDKIVIQGQSMGGYGCLYMAAYRPNFFSTVVPVSAYNSNVDLSKLENVPIRCYVGTGSCGEDPNSVSYVTGTLKRVFGEENIFQRATSHDGIPIVAFEEDLNEDNKSDLVEWMLSQTRTND